MHNVFVDDEPASVYVSKDSIPDTFEYLQSKIQETGGLKLGLDHLPTSVLEEYPILGKLKPLDVGRITSIESDGKRIYATETEHTNSMVQELYDNGELPAYSIVASFEPQECPNTDADFILKNFTDFERVDYVDEGGCTPCKTEHALDDIILTAKLSKKNNKKYNEVILMAEDNNNETAAENNSEEEVNQLDRIEQAISTLVELLKKLIEEDKTEEEGDSDVAAALATKVQKLELEAKKAKIEPIVNMAIKAGKILQNDKEIFIEQGLQNKDLNKFKNSLEKRPALIDFQQYSKTVEAGKSGTKWSKEKYEEICEQYGIKKEDL